MAGPRSGYKFGDGPVARISATGQARAHQLSYRVDLLKVAKHGRGDGDNVYLVRFRYVAPARRPAPSI